MSNRTATDEESLSRLSTSESEPVPTAGQTVIVLHDLTSGPEAEIGRLRTRVMELTDEIGSLRKENQGIKAEMREIKTVLSKLHLNELRGLDKVNSWLRALKRDL